MTCCLEAPGLEWQLAPPLAPAPQCQHQRIWQHSRQKSGRRYWNARKFNQAPFCSIWSSLILRIFSQFEMRGEHVSPMFSISLLFFSYFFFWLKRSLDKGFRKCTWRNPLWRKVDKETVFGSYRLIVVLFENIGSTNSIMLTSFSERRLRYWC